MPPPPTAPTAPAARGLRLPSGPVLVGVVYAVCVLGAVTFFGGQLLLTDVEPSAPEGPLDSMLGIGLFGSVALVVVLSVVLALRRRPSSARVGTFGLLALAVVTLPFFWCGAPGLAGAGAAWLGGLARGAPPQTGSARVAGLVGLLLAALNVVFNVVAFGLAALAG